jgi:hypothetical protein
MVAAQINSTRAGDYFALLAYLPPDPAVIETLEDIRRRLRHTTRRAVTLGYGPRYLHSSGQLHKGGPNIGIFMIITADVADDIAVPGEPYSFGTMLTAQAVGDLAALQEHRRRVFRLHLSGDLTSGLQALLDAIDMVDERRK